MYLPRADSGRLIIGTWWLVVLIVVTTYCGNLVAYLTFPKIEIPITTINQLIRHQSSISWGLKSGSYLEEYLKVNNFFLFSIVYQSIYDFYYRKQMNQSINVYLMVHFSIHKKPLI